MLSRVAKLMLTSTAIAPVLLTYAWVAFQSGDSCVALVLAAACVALVFVCWLLLRYAKNNLERMSFKPVSIEAADRENMGFLLLYLLPLFTAQFDALNWNVWIPAILIFAGVVATGYSYHFNPLLGLMGWHFYKVGTAEGVTYVLITKKQLRNATDTVEIGQLTEYIVLDLGEE
ncbi:MULTISPECIES: hypothetical protein [Pseudomonadota]|jgi:hypothetical protein|uniref:Uncharacterized protein n=1 Tax=Allorhizobium borbori TaxID=485907 RepID=A0A7W6K849_9HYPH|nr:MULTISPECIES: hypothetical protein [Alphaproteobacteria]MBB4105905.1 hypothetical protein [Allorhizobium borbori]WBX85500.1 hypothetical protein PE061_06145 [Sphingosinicella microcystinivorans]